MKAPSNLERFLQCTTPSPPSMSLPLSRAQDLNSLWQVPGKDEIQYFKLGDLWKCYSEWSAFGVGVPVELNNGETVTQYYVPYLSAVQIYTNKSSSTLREDNEAAESESDSWSDDSVSDKLSRSLSANSSKTWDGMSEDSSVEQDNASPMRGRLGYLHFQYFEIASPYWRIPLADKVVDLVRGHPQLMSLRSVDLSPASWMAVAWYPIYHIPFRKNEKDLLTCFLTYHTLSSSFQDDLNEHEDGKVRNEAFGKDKRVLLAPFGLATYKMQGDLWAKPETCDHERLIHLYSAADSWLKQLSIYHHDFNFFAFHSAV